MYMCVCGGEGVRGGSVFLCGGDGVVRDPYVRHVTSAK